jgi:hypothetical protein
MIDSVGILDSGHTSGYLYCSSNTSADKYRFEPCVLHQDGGNRKCDSKARSGIFISET